MSQSIAIHIVQGNVAPRYDDGAMQELTVQHCTLTEQGTQAHLPIVDLVMTGKDGKKYLLVLTGRIINTISAAVRGVNMRNHGMEEP